MFFMDVKQQHNIEVNDSVLYVRLGNRDNFPYFSIKTYSVTQSCQDGSNEGSRNMFSLRNMENYLQYCLLSGAESCLSSNLPFCQPPNMEHDTG